GRRGQSPVPGGAAGRARFDRPRATREADSIHGTEGTPAPSEGRRGAGGPPARPVPERTVAHRERAGLRPERCVRQEVPRPPAPRLRRHDRIGGQADPARGLRPGEGGPRLAGVEYRDVLYKSDRIPLHYEWAEELLATGEAYVCECR